MSAAVVTKRCVTKLCACGCGESIRPRATGRPPLHVDRAHKQKAYRQRVERAALEERARLFRPVPCDPDDAPRWLWKAADRIPEDALLLALVGAEVCAEAKVAA